MALSTYAELKTSVESWLKRSDLTSMIPDFIALAEARMSIDLNTYWQTARATCSTTANDQYVTIPDDVIQVQGLTQTGATESKPLMFLSLLALSGAYTDLSVGTPEAFAIIGNQLKLGPIPSDVLTLELIYKQRIPALSDTNTTNWVLTNYPDIYLWASLQAAQPYIFNDERLITFGQAYQTAVNQINRMMYNPVGMLGGLRMRAA